MCVRAFRELSLSRKVAFVYNFSIFVILLLSYHRLSKSTKSSRAPGQCLHFEIECRGAPARVSRCGDNLLEGAVRPNLKSEDSGLRHRFSEAKVSLWMCENDTGHEEARGPTRR